MFLKYLFVKIYEENQIQAYAIFLQFDLCLVCLALCHEIYVFHKCSICNTPPVRDLGSCDISTIFSLRVLVKENLFHFQFFYASDFFKVGQVPVLTADFLELSNIVYYYHSIALINNNNDVRAALDYSDNDMALIYVFDIKN